MGEGLIVRAATAADAEALAAIYGDACLHGTGTFEETPPGADEMARRQAAVVARGLPYYVAEMDGRVAAYAYASPFRPRTGYRYTAEDSVYVAPWAKGRGLGGLLLTRVIADCEQRGLRQLMAVIGGSENIASIALHRALGFELKGVMTGVGFKFGRWMDIVMMMKPLNGGTETLPEGPGLPLGGG
ncbi:MAG TPA: N-acetyltransferase family protein [Caulobacter sp.]|nr:N-acetyltransferase family protein [Caulobacter sp.]